MKEIYIDEDENLKKVYLIENKKIIEKHTESIKNPMTEGNIYVGKVQNVLPGMKSAFINIGISKNAFIHLKDLLPKEDVTKKIEEKEIDIRKIVKPGDFLIVQVTRDENHKKGAKVTTHISFCGQFFVFMPDVPFVTISQKIEDESKKAYLKNIIKNNLPNEIGGIVRTNAINAKEEEILAELKSLNEKWEKIKNINVDKFPKKIYDAGGIIRKYIIDNYNIDRISVKNEKILHEVREILQEENINKKILVESDYLQKYDYEKQILKMENRKIWLKCGGFITIDKTEAVTAIDVNSGKFTGSDDFEKTIFEVNKEATIEIAKQLKLRDLGGIIIIDYIDMHIEENKKEILNLIKEETKKDSSKVQIEGFTKLNLFELTRKHIYTV